MSAYTVTRLVDFNYLFLVTVVGGGLDWSHRLVPTMHHPHDIVFIKVKLQLLEFTKRFKCPFNPAKVV